MEKENNQNADENKEDSREKKISASQPQEITEKLSMAEFCLRNGIPTADTTHLHIGETSIMFSSTNKKPEDDSAAAAMRYLNLRKGQ